MQINNPNDGSQQVHACIFGQLHRTIIDSLAKLKLKKDSYRKSSKSVLMVPIGNDSPSMRGQPSYNYGTGTWVEIRVVAFSKIPFYYLAFSFSYR